MKHPRLTRLEWSLLVAFVATDLALFFIAKKVLNTRDVVKQEAQRAPVSAQVEIQAVERLEKLASGGSWDALENARAQQAETFLKNIERPTRGIALYFFPETLSPFSLEKEFADLELKPGLEELKDAYKARSEQAALQAYEKLETRVENYELGNSTDEPEEALSDEAKRFLRTYRSFTSLR